MDDDLNSLIADFGSAGVSQLNEHVQHPRFREFKNENKEKERQRERRQEAMERQKSSREDYIMKLRGLISDEKTEPKGQRWMGSESSAGRPRKNKEFADQFMTSEWLVDIPEDLDSWIMVPCPKARRCLVVACNGVTTAYSKAGNIIDQFPSNLPAGNYALKREQHKLTVLDCFMSERKQNQRSRLEESADSISQTMQEQTSSEHSQKKTIWILDLICWKDFSMTESEFDCRQAILKGHLDEDPTIGQRTSKNPYAIVGLPYCQCTKEAMTEMLSRDFDFELDGLLFYNPQIHYTPGQNAMIGWLEPWMMPEILNVPIPDRLRKKENPTEQAKDYMVRYEQVSNSMYTGTKDRYAGRLNVTHDTDMSEPNGSNQSEQSEALDLSMQ